MSDALEGVRSRAGRGDKDWVNTGLFCCGDEGSAFAHGDVGKQDAVRARFRKLGVKPVETASESHIAVDEHADGKLGKFRANCSHLFQSGIYGGAAIKRPKVGGLNGGAVGHWVRKWNAELQCIGSGRDDRSYDGQRVLRRGIAQHKERDESALSPVAQ